jgi:uncharacterized damage-inducible protein DinB
MPSQALNELLHGKGAHVDPLASVEDVDAELAARQVAGFPHSIAQLVFHMNYWMEYELRRIRGESPRYPEHNSESFPGGASLVDSQEWERLKKQFAELLGNFAVLANSSSNEMARQIASAPQRDTKLAGTLEALLWQMVAHNSYHVGQVTMIRRMLGAWPPLRGGDAW